MKTIEELKKRKKELHYTNLMISDESGVPLGTVQKIFSGATKHPRYDTLQAIEKVLDPLLPYEKKKGSEFEAEAEAAAGRKLDPVEADYWQFRVDPVIVHEEALEWEDWNKTAVPSKERWPRQGEYTIKDYMNIPDACRVELINGVIYDLSAPTLEHQTILAALYLEFEKCIDSHEKDCRVLFAPVDVRIKQDETTMLQPDLLVLCHEDKNKKYIDSAPEFVAEILSPSTRKKDCLVKLQVYAEAGVQEYWMVDPLYERILVYVFSKDLAPVTYSFHDRIPVGISNGECEIDFEKIYKKLERSGLLELKDE